MSLLFTCSCGKKLQVNDEMAGKKVRCPGCQAVNQVTAAQNIPTVPPPLLENVTIQNDSNARKSQVSIKANEAQNPLPDQTGKRSEANASDRRHVEEKSDLEMISRAQFLQDLVETARFHRLLIILFLVNCFLALGMAILQMVMPPPWTPTRLLFGAETSIVAQIIFGVVALLSFTTVTIVVFQLSSKLFEAAPAIFVFWFISAPIPILSLILLLFLDRKVRSLFAEHGLPCGFLGLRESEVTPEAIATAEKEKIRLGMTINASRSTTASDLLHIALLCRSISGYLFLGLFFGLCLGCSGCLINPKSPETFPILMLFAFAVLVMGVRMLVQVGRLTWMVVSEKNRVWVFLLYLLSPVPLVNLLLLFMLTSRASRILRAHGVRVGLLGPNLSDVYKHLEEDEKKQEWLDEIYTGVQTTLDHYLTVKSTTLMLDDSFQPYWGDRSLSDFFADIEETFGISLGATNRGEMVLTIRGVAEMVAKHY